LLQEIQFNKLLNHPLDYRDGQD